MAKFNYDDYQTAVNRAQNSNNDGPRVGFFKLSGNGATALARLDCASIDDLCFDTVHKPVFGKKYDGLANPYAGISCLNAFGQRTNSCPLCAAANKEGAVVGQAKKMVYVKMLVAYFDRATNTFSEAVPVVWERPAGFSREIATKLKTYKDLRQRLFLITRNGTGTDTTYTLDYAPAEIYSQELVPADFSTLDALDISRHSFWEKTADEVNAFLSSGTFATNSNQVKVDTVSQFAGAAAGAADATCATDALTMPSQAGYQPAVSDQATTYAPTARPTQSNSPNYAEFTGYSADYQSIPGQYQPASQPQARQATFNSFGRQPVAAPQATSMVQANEQQEAAPRPVRNFNYNL